jgi:hypothetical protein
MFFSPLKEFEIQSKTISTSSLHFLYSKRQCEYRKYLHIYDNQDCQLSLVVYVHRNQFLKSDSSLTITCHNMKFTLANIIGLVFPENSLRQSYMILLY